MRFAFRMLPSCFVCVLLFWPARATATTIDPLLLEELVFGADFVGVVECSQAGGIVAEYKVIESWKGAKVGDTISIRVAVNYWEPQFPIALCGERYFVTAYKEPPSRVISTTSGGGVPLWWRNIPSDYRLPLFQGRRPLASGEEKTAEFEKLRKEVQALLALKPEGREAALLKAVMKKDLFGGKWMGGEKDEAKAKELHDRLLKVNDAGDLVVELIRLASDDPKKWSIRTQIVLGKAGGAITLAKLEKLPVDKAPWEKEALAELIEGVKARLAPPAPPKVAPPVKEKVPTMEELAKFRKILADGEEADDFGDAVEALVVHDPTPVVEYLTRWQNPNKDWRDANRGYVLGSYFAWRCGKDRVKHLTALSGAKDPFIRVAGAVYLCFEDAEAGTVALKKLTALDGDPGAWAALTLARRGDKNAVGRTLEVFRELPKEQRIEQGGMAGVPHRNLQKRVRVLLSNSAQAGGVQQPALPEQEEKQFDYLTEWWKRHGEKAVVRDPWLKVLEKQKID